MDQAPRADRDAAAPREPLAIPEAANTLESRVDELAREVAQSTAQLKELVRLSDTEQVLSVLNHRAFLREATRICLMARRHKFPLAMLYVNIDRFQAINQAWGRRGGDAVLEQVANHLNQLMRGSDLVGRVGADEFCALMSHSSQEAAASKGAALSALLREDPPLYLGRPVDTHATYGAIACDGRMISEAMDAAVSDILEQRQHRLP
jgi:diguanylate cyclase (GGDEF)-like protein